MEDSKESIENYQITLAHDIDFLKIIEILNVGKLIDEQDITKSYVHLLFTPLLSYIIDYLNHKKSKKDKEELNIGISKIDKYRIVYATLNEKIYDLFFNKKKGKIGDNEINYDIKNENENYTFAVKKKSFNNSYKEILNESLDESEENVEKYIENDKIETIYELKKKEIISTFRLGYSIQERIINYLIKKANNKIIELPNIIFYQKNEENKLYSEMDGIITVTEDTEVKDFLIYLKAEFRKNKKVPKITENPKGDILKFKKNSCYLIEVKTSINSLMENEEKEKGKIEEGKKDIKESKTYRSDEVEKKIINNFTSISYKDKSVHTTNSSKDISDSKRKIINIYSNIQTFKKLFDNLERKFESLNLVLIIDSYFPKNFIEVSKNFVEKLEEKKFNFNLNIYFVHFEINYEYTYAINESKEKDEKITKLEIDATEKDEKIKKLEIDAEMSKINYKNTRIEITQIKKKLRLKSMKKKIQDNIEEFIEKESQKYKKVKNKNDYYIISEQKISDFNWSRRYKKIKNKNIKNILDFKTFCKIYYKSKNKDLIDIVKEKHLKNLKEYFDKKEYTFLLFLVDFVFLYYLKDLLKNVCDYNITIELAETCFFIVKFYPKKDKNLKSTYLFNEEILGTEKNNLADFIDLKNFIDYYFETLEIRDNEQLDYFPIYNPLTDNCDYFLTIVKTNDTQAKKNIILIVEPIFEYNDLIFKYKDKYKYYFFLLKRYDFKFEEKILQNIPLHFLFGEKIVYDYFKQGEGKVLYEDEYKCIKLKNGKDIACIFDKKGGRLLYKYYIEKNNSFDKNKIIDDKIEPIIELITKISQLDKTQNLNILIEEPFNLIYSYIKSNNIKCDIVLLNNNYQNKNINKFLTTNIETKFHDISIDSYFDTLEEKKYFDFIILHDISFPDENSDVIPKNLFYDDKLLTKIKNHLNKGGIFCFNLLFKNQYLVEKYEDIIEKKFKFPDIREISIIEEIAICSDAEIIE